MSCARCQALAVGHRINSPDELRRAIAVADARIADGTLEELRLEDGYCSPTPFAEVAAGGSWDDIVRMMRDANTAFVGRSMQEFMATEARRGYSLTGVTIPTRDAESFIRGSADAGLLRIVR